MINIGVGSKTSTGGAVIEGNPGISFDGLVASSVGHKATCPACKKGIGPIVAVGPRTITLPAGPAARAGDYVACGCPAGSNVLLPEGTVFIGAKGSGHALASATAGKPAPPIISAASESLRRSSTSDLSAKRFSEDSGGTQSLPHSDEEEEEEEEREQSIEQRNTLRIGMFFDGTGNNLANSALTAECRRQDLEEFDEEILTHIRQLCEQRGYQDTNSDGLYDQTPSDSFGNELSNVALLYELYKDQANQSVDEAAAAVSVKVYIDGIGTIGGQEDVTWGLASGQGSTGVAARVNSSPSLLNEKLRELVEGNPHLLIEKIEFDIFGFSRGAAAARHFANEILKPKGGIFADKLNDSFPAMAEGFEWATDVCINFIGLFDTVAAIAAPSRGNFSVGDDRNPGINLYLPPGCARKVVHLTAADEHRHNFSLNRVHPSHEELALPGVHSNLGGGYPAVVRERLLVGAPRVCRNIYYSPETIDRRKLEESRAWRGREAEEKELAEKGLPGEGEFRYENVVLTSASGNRNDPARDVILALGLERRVRGELSRIPLKLMHLKAIAHDVPLNPIPVTAAFAIPAELQMIAKRIIDAGIAGRSPVLTDAEVRYLHAYYIHRSASWTSTSGLMINKPRRGNNRGIYEDQPQRGYPV